ncbi:GNAT family N-acetyltransferase [Streptomyces sp. NPDC090106]|uniref:GNAT family N-acetyltransferase n=1 Tax=Streptomyces sp. NPDC090106 TaxID=3365946 RepID=UPI00380859A7
MEITVCGPGDVELLDRHIGSPGTLSFHARRFARQERGESTYLVAWLGRRPVGHAEVRWNGCEAAEVTVRCPEINALGVRPEELRSRGIGTALIRAAEDLVARRGIATVGIGVGKDNPRAAALYARLGYEPLVAYHDRWSYEGDDGQPHESVDACVFLTRDVC